MKPLQMISMWSEISPREYRHRPPEVEYRQIDIHCEVFLAILETREPESLWPLQDNQDYSIELSICLSCSLAK